MTRDPLLRTPEERDAIAAEKARRAAVEAACTRSPVEPSLDALAAKYRSVASLRSAARLLMSTLMGFTADDLRNRVNEVHGPSFDVACEALWDVLSEDFPSPIRRCLTTDDEDRKCILEACHNSHHQFGRGDN